MRIVQLQKTRNVHQNKNVHEVSQMIGKKLDEGDVRGAVRLAASDDSFEPISMEVLNILQSKHPQKKTARSPAFSAEKYCIS